MYINYSYFYLQANKREERHIYTNPVLTLIVKRMNMKKGNIKAYAV